ncbi:MAG: replication factor C small subunit [Candidatus Dojkabacteria bacterium]|nr:replication factor C small subunit [Candidatus Dojkabacteria bacterium]
MDYEVWLEKYRAKKLDDIAGQEQVTERLKAYVKVGNFPNLLFTGSPGTGKTSCALCMAREIFGENWHGNFKEWNASDTRGIDVVRNEIKQYANTKPLGQYEFKIAFLDECDALTSDAQAALRRTMEKYSSNCKFILSCNWLSKIIEPISSRCAVYRFKGVNPEAMKQRLSYIAKKENLTIGEASLDSIVYVSEGDMRKAVGTLEVASLMGKNITVDSIYKSSGLARREDIRNFIETCLSGNYMSAFEKLDILMIMEGLSAQDLLTQIFKETMILNVKDKTKVDIVDITGETDFRISEGANERIQMRWFVAKLGVIGKLVT